MGFTKSNTVRIIAGMGAAVASGAVAAAWYFSSRVQREAITMPRERWAGPTVNVVDVDVAAGTVTLPLGRVHDTDLGSNERAALRSDDGFAELGDVVSETDETVTRAFTMADGELLRPGQEVQVDAFVYRHNPGDLGLAFDDVVVDGPLGDLPAWFLPGASDTWIILVHGFHAYDRREALRYLPFLDDFPRLVVTYRNDEGAPSAPRLQVGFGQDEWPDVQAAIRYALDHGARDVVLYGYSMGGAISIATALESPVARSSVRALILDSPAADFAEVVRFGGADLGVPDPIVRLSLRAVESRFGVDLAALNYVARAHQIRKPMLILAGEGDTTVPHPIALRFANATDDCTIVSFAAAGHVRGWNVDQARYESAVLSFLSDVLSKGASA